MMEWKYKYKGELYNWKELLDLLVALEEVEEKKKSFWKRTTIYRYPFSCGFIKGMHYGVSLITDPKNNELINKKWKKKRANTQKSN